MKTSSRKCSGTFGLAGIAAALVLILISAPKADAHARMVRSIPAKNAGITKSPEQLELWFNELLEDGFNTLEVYPSAELTSNKHGNLTKGKPVVDAKDHTHLSVKLEPLPPGEYVVEWRVLSRDGHSAPGRITFRVVVK